MARRYNRRRYKKKAWYDKKYSAQELAAKAMAGVITIKRSLNPEHKNHESQISIGPTGTGQIENIFTNILQGDGSYQRDGDSLKITNIEMRFGFANHTAVASNSIRLILVKDRQQVADTPPTVSDILQTNNLTSGYATATKGRFTVLYNKIINLKAPYAGALTWTYIPAVFIPQQLHVLYNGTGVADIQKNGLYLLAISDNNASPPTVYARTRVTFVDN